MTNELLFSIPPWPECTTGSYRFFEDGEKHITRVCDYFVLIIMLENTLYFTENDLDISVSAGEWYIQVPGLKQEGKIGSPAPVYYYLHFNASGVLQDNSLDTISSDWDSSSFKIPVRGNFDLRYLKPFLDQLDTLLKSRAYDILGKEALFLTIMKHLATSNPQSEGLRGFIDKVMEYLALNYNKPLVCSGLSEKFHFTSDYITRKMKQYTGTTPWQYIQQIRLDRAKELLNSTDYTLASIANLVGYSDLSLFYKAFKKSTGTAPGEWRKQQRQKY